MFLEAAQVAESSKFVVRINQCFTVNFVVNLSYQQSSSLDQELASVVLHY
jgi:hypothetical protein